MLRVAVIDDERLAREGIRRLLAAHPGLQLVGEADSKESALALLREEKPDGVFLDIRMPGCTGFELLHALDTPPKVVMVTAYAEHALRAFDIEAVDYLLKPVKPARFAKAVQRLIAACAAGPDALGSTGLPTERLVHLRTPQKTLSVPANYLLLLQAEGDFTRIFMKNPPPLMICTPLGQYEKLLPSPPFIRLDRSLILNLQTPFGLKRKSRDKATLSLDGVDEEIPLGRTAQRRLLKYLGAAQGK